jgi:hypothetical protein
VARAANAAQVAQDADQERDSKYDAYFGRYAK